MIYGGRGSDEINDGRGADEVHAGVGDHFPSSLHGDLVLNSSGGTGDDSVRSIEAAEEIPAKTR